MTNSVILLVTIFLFVNLVNCIDFPKDIPQCKNDDQSCLQQAIDEVVHNHFSGHRGLHLIPIDPLKIRSMLIAQNSESPVSITLKFTEFLLIGFKNMKVYSSSGFKKDIMNSNFEVDVKIPSLVLTGPYEIKGRVLVLPITGHGQSNLTLENVDAKIKLLGHPETKDGEEYFHLTKVKLDFDITRLRVNFENLFNGDKALGDNMNLFINENWKEIFAEINQSIAEAISEVLLIAIQGPFSAIPYRKLFLP
ncbi:unnamed protein product [Hermetia illucens]|uniref:Uncharacterized protein n=1 Tax=Hermetia illucens TaxID=343691 RepID=A0A7R8V8F7_HERIL|nr:protein takeout-like [Hermetia illucens]CAD7093430.1 unnamed protein product [Hermetia illucens]